MACLNNHHSGPEQIARANASSAAISLPLNLVSALRSFAITAEDLAHSCNCMYCASRPFQKAFHPVRPSRKIALVRKNEDSASMAD
jgi:hypothetical protein